MWLFDLGGRWTDGICMRRSSMERPRKKLTYHCADFSHDERRSKAIPDQASVNVTKLLLILCLERKRAKSATFLFRGLSDGELGGLVVNGPEAPIFDV